MTTYTLTIARPRYCPHTDALLGSHLSVHPYVFGTAAGAVAIAQVMQARDEAVTFITPAPPGASELQTAGAVFQGDALF